MPMKLTVGLLKKIGQPDYGSLGASCQVELELPSASLPDDLEAFHRQVRHAYHACSQAVGEELARQQNPVSGKANGHKPAEPALPATPAPDGHANGSSTFRATQKQLEYCNQLAGKVRGLGVRRLETLVQKMFHKPVVELTSLDASALIDSLKAIKAGQLDLEAALGEPVR